MDKMIRLLMLFQNYCPPIGRGKGIDGLYMNQNLRSRKDKETKALSQKKKADEVTFKICALSWSDNLWLKTGS